MDSVNEPISALDCPQTTNARRIEQQAQRMIMSSFSPVDENLNNRNPNCHRCLTWQCKRSYNNTAPGLNTTGQVSGNLKTPKGAEHIITESDDSLVHVEMGSPQVDFSLLRQAAHDLRALDATLLQKSQSRQLGTSSRSGCITSAEEDGYSCGKKESVPVEDTGIGEFDDLEILFAMDEESEFEFPGLDYALATDPDECPQMKYVSQRSVIISEAPKNLVQAQQGEMDYIEEKVLGMGLSEDESLV